MSDSQVRVHIEGMTCPSCVYKIECEVGDIEGVKEAKVDLASKIGTFSYDAASSTAGPAQIVAKITELGFKAQLVLQNQTQNLKLSLFLNSTLTLKRLSREA
jgi:copper chaperone CopZ